MKRVLFLLISAIILISLCTCELSMEAPKQGKTHILVYGNDYWYTTDLKLKATVNDAVQVGLALSKLCQKCNRPYDVTFVYGDNIVDGKRYFDPIIKEQLEGEEYVIDPDVTRTSLLDHLDALASDPEASDNDMVFIYFSGHGSSGLKNKIAPYGGDDEDYDIPFSTLFVVQNDYVETSTTMVRSTEITERIESIPGTKIVLSDFCYSGGFVEAGYVSYTPNEYTGMDAEKMFGLKEEICEKTSTFYLSAARYYEISQEEPAKAYSPTLHGYFTRALLEALGWDDKTYTLKKGGAYENGMITFFSVARYTWKNDHKPQVPMFNGGSNDIVLFSY